MKQFTLRVPENLAKVKRIKEIYKEKIPDAPALLFKILEEQEKRLENVKAKYGDYPLPSLFEKE